MRQFVAFPQDEAADAVTLWATHTWVFEAFDITPRLSIESAEMRSGKSRLLEVLTLFVRRPFPTVLPSEAVVFRSIEAHARGHEKVPTCGQEEVPTLLT